MSIFFPTSIKVRTVRPQSVFSAPAAVVPLSETLSTLARFDKVSDKVSDKGMKVSERTLNAYPPRGGAVVRRISRRLLVAGVALAFGVGLNRAGAAAPGGAGASIVSWINAQTNLQSWTAAVRQIRSFKTMSEPLVETGRVWFAAPNKFRWEIGSPAKTIAVREPQEMLVIYPRLKRAERFPLSGPEAGPWKDTLALLEAGFPRSAAELEARFKVTASTCSNSICQITLQPRAAGARRMMPSLNVVFSTTDYMLRATELHFADGSFMRNEFSDGTINPTLAGDTFQPHLAADVELVEPLKQKKR